MGYTKIDGKIWALNHRNESIGLRLASILNNNWSLRDLHDITNMIEREPVIKEAVIELLNIIEGGKKCSAMNNS